MNPHHHHHHHHHPGMALGHLPIGMLANSSGTPLGIGIRLPIMTASLPPPMVHQQPPPATAISSNAQMIVSVSPDSSDDIEKCLRMNSSATMSPVSSSNHQTIPHVSVSQANCNGHNNGNNLQQHWNTILQQPMAGMLMNPAMMGMGVPGVIGPASCMTEPNMLYGMNLLNNQQSAQAQHRHPPPQIHHALSSPSSNISFEIPQQPISNNNNISITTNSSSTTSNGQQSPMLGLHNLPSGIVNGSISSPICSTVQQQQQQQQSSEQTKVKEIIHCKSCTLFPPNPSAPSPTTRERPPGCRTVFVGGLPENGNEDLVREIFDRCGEITTIRMSKKNFCHIRFELESYIDNAIYLSGYRVRIGSNSDASNIGRLHVDFAQARDDLYEWECRQRQLLREQRHRERLEQERLLPPSPPPVAHYSDHEALNLAEKLKGDESFMKAVQVLMTWLERGDCSKKNANTFYSMIQSTNSHVRRLLNEKTQFEEELQKAKELARQRMQGLILQFCQIEKVFVVAGHKKAWDHFSKAQRKNIDIWRKQASEIKNIQLEEALNDRNEEEMELSESDCEDNSLPKRLRIDDDNEQMKLNQLKEENDSLRCQLEAFKYEVDLLKADLKTELEAKDQQIRVLQEQLMSYRQSPPVISSSPTQSDIELQPKSSSLAQLSNLPCSTNSSGNSSPKTTPSITNSIRNRISITSNNIEKRLERCDSTQQLLLPLTFSTEVSSNENSLSPGDKEPATSLTTTLTTVSTSSSSNNISRDSDGGTNNKNPVTVVGSCSPPRTFPPQSIYITEKEARLIGIISTFLHVHPFGASLDYIWSYAQKTIPGVYPIQIEALMLKFTSLFRQEMTGIGATLERKWIFTGFSSNNNNSHNSQPFSNNNSNNNSVSQNE